MSANPKGIFADPSYIVLNIPSPVADDLRGIRSFFDPPRANLAIEISLCGSNGRGIITPGQDPDKVFSEIDRIAAQSKAFSAKLGHVKRFPDTGIFYYTLATPAPFKKLHDRFVRSKIKFEPTLFPYEPHCTIKLGQQTEYSEDEMIKHLQAPEKSFIIDTISVYGLSKIEQIPRLLHRVNLGEK